MNGSWVRFNAVAMAAAAGTWRVGRSKEAEEDLGIGAALFNGAVSGVLAARVTGQSREGDTPVESGTQSAPETPEEAAKSQRLIGFFGTGPPVSLAAAVAVSVALEVRTAKMGTVARLLS